MVPKMLRATDLAPKDLKPRHKILLPKKELYNYINGIPTKMFFVLFYFRQTDTIVFETFKSSQVKIFILILAVRRRGHLDARGRPGSFEALVRSRSRRHRSRLEPRKLNLSTGRAASTLILDWHYRLA